MIEIDGSYGEGGGQILRVAVALSGILGEDIRVYNIRKGRKNPGLAPQHLRTIRTAEKLCNAEVKGAELGSTEIIFKPGEIERVRMSADIGTAGSITLLLQCILPMMMVKGGELTVRGGTDVRWSPTVDYFKNVFLRALSADVHLEVRRRGFYPAGGGEVFVRVEPSEFRALRIIEPLKERIRGISLCGKLPAHVAERQKRSALEVLGDAEIEVLRVDSLSPGSSITLWSGFKGACDLGEKGRPAEDVGRKCAEMLREELSSRGAVDMHLADQLIIYMALGGSSEITTSKITNHTRSSIWVVEKFLDVRFEIEEEERMARITCSPL
ncbi:MAG: RNA 3'-terminal phosphate cyclase [Archaeoglobi archaeon]|nr:RNA 3'-terminal phosphate cyclase [Candidatus Mnemosynella bozhongmuii]